MNLPSREECFRLLKEFHTPENIIKHTLAVNKLCMDLGRRLKARGEKIDLELLDRASLLHDLDKFMTLREDYEMHGIEACRILRKRGYPELAEIVRKHRILTILRPGELRTWEEKLVYYADKRVVHDRVVPVREKMEYLAKAYNMRGRDLEKLKKCEKETLKLEKEILERDREH